MKTWLADKWAKLKVWVVGVLVSIGLIVIPPAIGGSNYTLEFLLQSDVFEVEVCA